jgi:hypothetical protein
MKKAILLPFVFILAIVTNSYCGDLEALLLAAQIAVEEQTGRGSENEFSGWVGSLRFDIQEKYIYIAEFTNTTGKIDVVNGSYKITKIEQYQNSFNFECVDTNPLTYGVSYSGKIWLTDTGVIPIIRIEMIMKQSPRRWINLGEFGKKFLKDNRSRLNLGM